METRNDVDVLRVPIGRRCCAVCVELVEQRLGEHPHVASVHVDPRNGVAHVEARTGKTSIDELAELAGESCGGRGPVLVPDATVSSHQHAHTAGHDMSDPRMAAAMEADMRRRFWISLVLAVPVIAFSSLGLLLLGGRMLPTPFGIPADWIMLAFATRVALWTSSESAGWSREHVRPGRPGRTGIALSTMRVCAWRRRA